MSDNKSHRVFLKKLPFRTEILNTLNPSKKKPALQQFR